jgi:Cytochrome c7 and related cytochrome c
MTKRWFVGGAATIAALASLAFFQVQDQAAEPPLSEVSQVAAPNQQPIAFPHNIHAGQDQIPCMYCHFSAERSVDAGIPPVATCNGCHQIIGGSTPAQQREIQKVRDFVAAGEPIPWVRIYKVADHVHFPHMRHINAGVDCAQCHGDVAAKGVLQEVEQTLGMGWCVSCHVENDASRDCAVCHY